MQVTYATLAYLVLLMLTVGPSLFPEHALAGRDWESMIYPFYRFSRDTFLAEGRLPFWNPYIYGGMPHLVSLNTLVLYPTEWLSLPLHISPSTFYAMDLIFHLCLAGIGMFLLLKRDGHSGLAAFMAGLFYILGGHLYTLAAAGQPHWVRCMAWLPFIMICLEKGRVDGRLRWYAWAGGLLGLLQWTAAMQFVAYASLVCSGWILFRRGQRETGWLAGLPGRFGRLGILAVVAAGIGAVILLPGYEYVLHSIRAVPRPEMASQWTYTPWEILTMVLPGLFGDASIYYGPHWFRSSHDYFGLLPLSMAFLGICARRRADIPWLILGGAGFLLAFGTATPAGAWLSHVPMFSGFRSSVRWLSFTHLALAMLAASGWGTMVARHSKARSYLVIFWVFVGLGCWWFSGQEGSIANRLRKIGFVRQHMRSDRLEKGQVDLQIAKSLRHGAIACLATSGALAMAGAPVIPVALRFAMVCGVGLGDVLTASSSYVLRKPVREQERPDEVTKFIQRLKPTKPFRVATDGFFMKPNRHMLHGLQMMGGFHGLPLRRPTALATIARFSKGGRLAAMSALNVKYLVFAGPAPSEARPLETLKSTTDSLVTVFENPQVLPRVFLARAVAQFRDLDAVYYQLESPGWHPYLVPIDSAIPEIVRSSVLAYVESPELWYGRDELKAKVSLDSPGVLVFSETWYPAWKAFVNGHRVRVLRAYGALRAVALPGGTHVVEMIYDSWLFKIGLWVSSCSVVLLAVLWAVFAVRENTPWAGMGGVSQVD